MAQADGVVANGTGSAVRSDINNQYAALWSNHSGSTEPSSGKVAFQTWADTNSGYLKIRNAANNGWVSLFKLDGTDIHFVNLNGSTNNTVCTVTGADAIQGEANLTFDGSDLSLRATKSNLIVAKTGLTVKASSALHTTYDFFQIGAGGAIASYNTETATASTQFIHNAYRATDGYWKRRYTDTVCSISMNSPGGEIEFFTAVTGNADTTITWTPTVQVKPNGNLNISDGDLVIGTAGHGIDFSANSHASGMSSETLDSYEEGTWSPTLMFGGNSTGVSYATVNGGSYVKIGRQVILHGRLSISSKGSSTGDATIGGFPFAAANVTSGTSSIEGDAFFSYLGNIVSSQDNAHVMGSIDNGETHIKLWWNDDSGDVNAIEEDDFENSTSLSFGCIYPAA